MPFTSMKEVGRLTRQSATDLVDLVGHHMKVLRYEFGLELSALRIRAGLVGFFVAIAGVGYALAMAGLATWLAELPLVAYALWAVGGANLAVSVLALLVGWMRSRRPARARRGTAALAALVVLPEGARPG